jgi:hypothetical protein
VFHENRVVKNVTVTLEETVAQWVRVRAAEKGLSVSRYLSEVLKHQMMEEDAYEAAMQEYFAFQPSNLNEGQPYPKRDELYDRPHLR